MAQTSAVLLPGKAGGHGRQTRQSQWRVREGFTPSSLFTQNEHLECCCYVTRILLAERGVCQHFFPGIIQHMNNDTSIGGHNDRFPETRVSVLISAHDADDKTRRRAREVVIAAYWKPVYKYIRIKWNASNEDAKDLTQGFFVTTLESRFFERFEAPCPPSR